MNPWFTALSILAILVLTAGTALFVAAEFSLTALERSTVDANAKTGDRRDLFVQRAHRTLSFQLSGAQLGISITTLATGYLAEPVVARLIEPVLLAVGVPARSTTGVALALSLLIATSLSMVFGELVPKNLAVARPVPTARFSAGPQLFFSTIFTLAIRATNGTANWILRRVGIEPADELASARTPQELVSLVRNSARSGSLDAMTALLVDRSLQFGYRTAEELMTPRSKIVALEADDTVADLVATAVESGHSRFPIIEGDLDETIGIVHVKQVFEVPLVERPTTVLSALAQPVAVVPSTLDGDALMGQIRANGLQTALVVDEYGGTAGMVTVEDLIEEIVGDVRDEHDDATPDVVPAGDGWQVSGLLRTDEVADATGYRAPEGEYETIGGLVLQELGHIPVAGESVELRAFDADSPVDDPVRWRATVVAMDGRRIDQLALIELGRRQDGEDTDDEDTDDEDTDDDGGDDDDGADGGGGEDGDTAGARGAGGAR
ncbi:hemolysin family protein [Mycolicibacterium palauense]|uniref:hemolysin family protein n=1 Tax=Mycolicibacterium palauense TaxID=2034511 RepID=UPI000BFEB816|nr:hemolysin family protein [Mycolicibacterium palauense]